MVLELAVSVQHHPHMCARLICGSCKLSAQIRDSLTASGPIGIVDIYINPREFTGTMFPTITAAARGS